MDIRDRNSAIVTQLTQGVGGVPLVFTDGGYWQYCDSLGATAPHWQCVEEHIGAWFQLRLVGHKVVSAMRNGKRTKQSKVVPTDKASFIHELEGYLPRAKELVKPGFFTRDPLFKTPRGITVRNGFLNFKDDGTPELLAHSHTHRSRYYIDTVYDPTAVCAYFETVLGSYFTRDADDDGPGKILAILEFVALCMFGQANTDGRGKILYATGDKGVGKSSLLENLVAACFDPEMCASVEPLEFSDDNSRLLMVGKLLNFRDEVSPRAWRNASIIKGVVSGSETIVKSLYHNRAKARITCGHLFASNDRALTGDSSGALQDRTWYVHFTHKYTRDREPAQYIKAKIMSERAGILNLLCRTYREMLARGGGVPEMLVPKSSLAMQKKATVEADALRKYVDRLVRYDEKAPGMTAEAIYAGFDNWKRITGVSEKLKVSAETLAEKVLQIYPGCAFHGPDGVTRYRVHARGPDILLGG